MKKSDLVILPFALIVGYSLFLAVKNGGVFNWIVVAVVAFGAGAYLWMHFQNRDKIP